MATPETPRNKAGKVAPSVPPKSDRAKFAGRRAIFEQNARNNALNQADSSSSESINSSDFIHTTTRKNNVGNGLNELNAKKNASAATPKPHVNVMKEAHELNPFRKLRERSGSDSSSSSSTSSIDFEALASSAQADLDRMMMENINAFAQNPNVQKPAAIKEFPELPECAQAPALFPKPSKEKIQEALDKARCKSSSSANSSPLTHNPIYQGKKLFSPDRFKSKHPSQQIEQPDFTKPAEIYSNLVRCSNTRSGETLEHNVERKNGFQVDLSVKHVKSPIATCSTTRGNGKEGVDKPDASSKQEPKSGMSTTSTVNVKELAKKFEQSSGRGC